MSKLTLEQQQLLDELRPVFDQYMLELDAMQRAKDAERQELKDQQRHARRIADLEYWAQENQRRDTLLANWLAKQDQGRPQYSRDPIVRAAQREAEDARDFPGLSTFEIQLLKSRHRREKIASVRQAIEVQGEPA